MREKEVIERYLNFSIWFSLTHITHRTPQSSAKDHGVWFLIQTTRYVVHYESCNVCMANKRNLSNYANVMAGLFLWRSRCMKLVKCPQGRPILLCLGVILCHARTRFWLIPCEHHNPAIQSLQHMATIVEPDMSPAKSNYGSISLVP